MKYVDFGRTGIQISAVSYGGIVSAGVDGIRCAHAVLNDENNF